jgi:glucosamine kinase
MAILIADSGSTKCEWCLIGGKRQETVFTQGISPYFLKSSQIEAILRDELIPSLPKSKIKEVHFYGTGLSNPNNLRLLKRVIKQVFPEATIEVYQDIMATARASCGHLKGVACILGTGSNCCYFNGRRIMKISPGLGYVLGDEGSGAYLGKKVIQYYLYNTFDEELRYKFDAKFVTNRIEILENTYKQPLPNRYLAAFTVFLAENRGHYMVENIIEDGLNDFFFQHLCKFNESWNYPIHFVGGVAYGFHDVLRELCKSYEFELGNVLKNPMEGLVKYHR